MHSLYSFDFLRTVSAQLHAELDSLAVTPLNASSLAALAAFQNSEKSPQGVYLLYLSGKPFYLGKADDVADRLRDHFGKLNGRQGIDLAAVGYKALLLDKSMSTAANEGVLIGLFGETYTGMWNNRGFGPKDPGQERDTTKPSQFDAAHPIRADHLLENVEDIETIETLFSKMKSQLPFVFRYKLGDGVEDRKVDLKGVPRNAKDILTAAINVLDPGWQGAVLSYGMVVYKTDKVYKYASAVIKPSHSAGSS